MQSIGESAQATEEEVQQLNDTRLHFEQIAINILDSCHKTSTYRTKFILLQTLDFFGGKSCMYLAYKGKRSLFLCSRTKGDEFDKKWAYTRFIWWGDGQLMMYFVFTNFFERMIICKSNLLSQPIAWNSSLMMPVNSIWTAFGMARCHLKLASWTSFSCVGFLFWSQFLPIKG